ncbi:hypothetical protein ABPG74_009152 [Tetrahymena malaccensis]
MKHFLYITPAILLFMYHSYQCFWKSKQKCSELYIILFCIGIFIFSGVFLGIFIGIFGQILKQSLYEVHNCNVIGQLKLNIVGISEYSILYVNYEKDGEVFLGYGCLDGQYRETAGIKQISPYYFYQYGDSYACSDTYLDDSYYDTYQTDVHTYFKSYPNPRSINNDATCTEHWHFSQVKLASWMCLPQNYPYNILQTTFDKCYISYYGNSNKAKLNSLTRANLKYAKDFTLVGFSDFLIPIHQYIIFLIFCYCPFIVTSVVITLPIQNSIQQQIVKSKKNLKKLYYIPYLERFNEEDRISKKENKIIEQSKKIIFTEIKQHELEALNQKDNTFNLDTGKNKERPLEQNQINKEAGVEQIILQDEEQKQQFIQQDQIQKDINL